MFTLDVKYVAITVGVLGTAVWGFVGSGWHYAVAMGSGGVVRTAHEDALAHTQKPTNTVPELEAVEAPTESTAPAVVAEAPEAIASTEAIATAQAPASAESSVTVLDDVYYDPEREALVVPFSGPAPAFSRIYRERDGLAFVDFSNVRAGSPRFKRQADAGFKSFILNKRPGNDRARLSFVVARPGELQAEKTAGEFLVRLTARP